MDWNPAEEGVNPPVDTNGDIIPPAGYRYLYDGRLVRDYYREYDAEYPTMADVSPGFVAQLPSPSHFDANGNIIHHIENMFKRRHAGPMEGETSCKRRCFGIDGIEPDVTVRDVTRPDDDGNPSKRVCCRPGYDSTGVFALPRDVARPTVSSQVQAIAAPVLMQAAPVQVVTSPVIERPLIGVEDQPDYLRNHLNTSGNEPQSIGSTPLADTSVPSPQVYRAAPSNFMHLEPLFYAPDSNVYRNEKK